MDREHTVTAEQRVSNPKRETDRVALLVIGAHRSGTSALTRVLSLLGCSLPRHVMEANSSNPAGHWEPQALVDLNNQILEAAGSAWNDLQRLNPGWENSPARAGFMRKAGRILQAEFEETSFFVIKDPRICRIAPFWLDVLRENGIDPRVIIPVRNPLEVAASLHKRDGMDPSVGYLVWLRHVLDAERGTRGEQRVFTTFGELLGNWNEVTTRIAEGLDISWPRYSPRVVSEIDAFLDRRLRNHNLGDHDILVGSSAPGWVCTAYQILLKWSSGGESPADHAALDAISDALEKAFLSFGKPMSLLQEATVELDDARRHVIEVERDRDLAIDRAASIERTLQQRSDEAERAAARLAQAEDALEEVRKEHLEALARAKGAELAVEEHAVEAKRRSARIAEVESALAKVRDEHAAALERAEGAEYALKECAEEIERLTERVSDAEKALETLQVERATAIERAQSAELSLKARAEEAEATAADFAAAEARNAHLQDELDSAHELALSVEQALMQRQKEHDDAIARLAETRSELLQRKEELRQVWAELDLERQRVEELERDRDRQFEVAQRELVAAGSELRQREEELKQVWTELDREVERSESLESALRHGADAVDAIKRQLLDAEERNASLMAECDRNKAKLADEGLALAESKAKLEASEAELEKAHALVRAAVSQRAQTLNEIAIVTQLLRDAEAERDRNKTELANWQDIALREQEQERHRVLQLDAVQKELADDRFALAESKARLEASEAELEKAHALARTAVSQRAQAFNEIAIVTQFLRDTQYAVQQREETVHWLSQIYALMLKRPKWWVFLSRKAQFKRLSQMAEERGLFDPESYLAKNPDVAATAVDPLRHYITHGIQECRPR